MTFAENQPDLTRLWSFLGGYGYC